MAQFVLRLILFLTSAGQVGKGRYIFTRARFGSAFLIFPQCILLPVKTVAIAAVQRQIKMSPSTSATGNADAKNGLVFDLFCEWHQCCLFLLAGYTIWSRNPPAHCYRQLYRLHSVSRCLPYYWLHPNGFQDNTLWTKERPALSSEPSGLRWSDQQLKWTLHLLDSIDLLSN